MEIITNYSNDTRNMISGSSYTLDSIDLSDAMYKIKLSVFSNVGAFLDDYILEVNKEYYVKNGNLFLRPNELLDRENFTEGNYTLRFDFIRRYSDWYENNHDIPPASPADNFYISEISPTRKEVRLSYHPVGDGEVSTAITGSLNAVFGEYDFNSFLELSQGRLIPINSYAFDTVTSDARTLILKLNTALPGDVSTLSTDSFTIGDHVEHKLFGKGKILAVDGTGGTAKLTILFSGNVRKKIIAKYTNLIQPQTP